MTGVRQMTPSLKLSQSLCVTSVLETTVFLLKHDFASEKNVSVSSLVKGNPHSVTNGLSNSTRNILAVEFDAVVLNHIIIYLKR